MKMYYWLEILGSPLFMGLGQDLQVHTVAEKPVLHAERMWERPQIEIFKAKAGWKHG